MEGKRLCGQILGVVLIVCLCLELVFMHSTEEVQVRTVDVSTVEMSVSDKYTRGFIWSDVSYNEEDECVSFKAQTGCSEENILFDNVSKRGSFNENDERIIEYECSFDMNELGCNDMQKLLTKSDVHSLSIELVDKSKMKLESDCFEKQGSICFYEGKVELDVMKEKASVMSVESNITLVTRSGNEIDFVEAQNPSYLTAAQVAGVIEGFEDCTIVDYSNDGFNCFAYAWLSLDEENEPYRESGVVNSQACFINDKAYKRTRATVHLGDVVSWSAHAGVVVRTAYTYQPDTSKPPVTEPLIISKWGAGGPLVQHPLNQCGYMGFDGYFYK